MGRLITGTRNANILEPPLPRPPPSVCQNDPRHCRVILVCWRICVVPESVLEVSLPPCSASTVRAQAHASTRSHSRIRDPAPPPPLPPRSHGTCSLGDVCTCSKDWMGPDCSLRVCPSGTSWALDSSTPHGYEECSGAGLCDRCVAFVTLDHNPPRCCIVLLLPTLRIKICCSPRTYSVSSPPPLSSPPTSV